MARNIRQRKINETHFETQTHLSGVEKADQSKGANIIVSPYSKVDICEYTRMGLLNIILNKLSLVVLVVWYINNKNLMYTYHAFMKDL